MIGLVILYFWISKAIFTAAFGVRLYFVCLTNQEHYLVSEREPFLFVGSLLMCCGIQNRWDFGTLI